MTDIKKEGILDGCFLTWVAITERQSKKEDQPKS